MLCISVQEQHTCYNDSHVVKMSSWFVQLWLLLVNLSTCTCENMAF